MLIKVKGCSLSGDCLCFTSKTHKTSHKARWLEKLILRLTQPILAGPELGGNLVGLVFIVCNYEIKQYTKTLKLTDIPLQVKRNRPLILFDFKFLGLVMSLSIFAFLTKFIFQLHIL